VIIRNGKGQDIITLDGYPTIHPDINPAQNNYGQPLWITIIPEYDAFGFAPESYTYKFDPKKGTNPSAYHRWLARVWNLRFVDGKLVYAVEDKRKNRESVSGIIVRPDGRMFAEINKARNPNDPELTITFFNNFEIGEFVAEVKEENGELKLIPYATLSTKIEPQGLMWVEKRYIGIWDKKIKNLGYPERSLYINGNLVRRQKLGTETSYFDDYSNWITYISNAPFSGWVTHLSPHRDILLKDWPEEEFQFKGPTGKEENLSKEALPQKEFKDKIISFISSSQFIVLGIVFVIILPLPFLWVIYMKIKKWLGRDKKDSLSGAQIPKESPSQKPDTNNTELFLRNYFNLLKEMTEKPFEVVARGKDIKIFAKKEDEIEFVIFTVLGCGAGVYIVGYYYNEKGVLMPKVHETYSNPFILPGFLENYLKKILSETSKEINRSELEKLLRAKGLVGSEAVFIGTAGTVEIRGAKFGRNVQDTTGAHPNGRIWYANLIKKEAEKVLREILGRWQIHQDKINQFIEACRQVAEIVAIDEKSERIKNEINSSQKIDANFVRRLVPKDETKDKTRDRRKDDIVFLRVQLGGGVAGKAIEYTRQELNKGRAIAALRNIYKDALFFYTGDEFYLPKDELTDSYVIGNDADVLLDENVWAFSVNANEKDFNEFIEYINDLADEIKKGTHYEELSNPLKILDQRLGRIAQSDKKPEEVVEFLKGIPQRCFWIGAGPSATKELLKKVIRVIEGEKVED